jgi:lipoprotein-anchoring transpeptidase ErfK/SrfK
VPADAARDLLPLWLCHSRHGTNDLARPGGPASHGCIRLHPSHAAALFVLVQHQGPSNTRIEISNQL